MSKPSPLEIAERAISDMAARGTTKKQLEQDREVFFQVCAENRELLKKVSVCVPVRPDAGVCLGLARMLSIWYGEGTPWNCLSDHMGGFIETTRAKMAYDFKFNQDEEYLLMIDNDIEPPMDLVMGLVRHQLPVVSACAMGVSAFSGPQLCFTVEDTEGKYRFPSLAKSGNIPSRGLVKAGHVGTGAVLIRRDVFEAFTFEGDDVPFFVPHAVRIKGMRTGELLLGEDLSFCNQIREKGFDCYVDMEMHCGHRKTTAMRWPRDAMDIKINASDWKIPPEGQAIALDFLEKSDATY